MSKLKRKIYSLGLKLGWAFYKWNTEKYWQEEDKLWNPLDEKKENTDRIIANADKYDQVTLDLWAKNIREQEQEDLAGNNIVEQVATLYDVPVDMIHSQGNNHKSKNK